MWVNLIGGLKCLDFLSFYIEGRFLSSVIFRQYWTIFSLNQGNQKLYFKSRDLFVNRGCLIKKFPSVLPIYAKMINLRVKSQAKCQIYFSRALKWGIVHLCTLNTSRDTMKYRKLLVFQFLHFCKKIVKSLCKIQKMRKIKKLILSVFNHFSNTI